MRRPPSATTARALRAWPVLLVLTLATLARAEGRVSFLSERLRYPPAAGQTDDFRVRTNAALALGSTDDDDAVGPLCGGLSDPSEVVRQAVAVALKKLARSASLGCLRQRLAVETNASAKTQMQAAIDAIDSATGAGAGAGASAGYVASAKYYVALSPITNNTSRPPSEIERIVKGAIASKLAQMGEYQMAPPGETNAAAKAAIGKRKLKGYYLGIGVEKFDYSDGNLRVRVRVAVFSYPSRDLRGEVPAGATLPGARPGDKGAEDQLLTVVAGQAAELFAQNFK